MFWRMLRRTRVYRGVQGGDARQDADCADGNKDVRIEATLLIPPQQAKPNQAVKSRRETALIRLCDTYKRCGSSPIDRMPQRGQIVCLGSEPEQQSSSMVGESDRQSARTPMLLDIQIQKQQHVCSKQNNQYHLLFPSDSMIVPLTLRQEVYPTSFLKFELHNFEN